MEDFDVWSNRQKERLDFEAWSNKQKEQDNFAMWSDEKKAAAQNNLDSVGKMYGLHPGVREVETAAQSQVAAPETKSPQSPVQKPYVPPGQAARLGERADRRQWRKQGGERVAATWDFGLSTAKEQNPLVATGIEATPTKSFSFSQSPKTEIPENRFTGEGTTLPGWQAKTGMVPIPSSVDISSEDLLAATPLGAYTNIWNIDAAGAPAASVFANMDDETLSQLIGAYTDQLKKLKSAGQQGNSNQGFDWGDFFDFWGNAADAGGLQAKRFNIVTPRNTPTPGSQPGVPGTIKVDINPFFTGDEISSADDVFKFRLQDGEINVTGLDYLLENGDLNALQKMFIESFDGAEVPEVFANLLKNSDELARATQVIKNGGTALGWIGAGLDLFEVGNTYFEDLYDEDKKIGKKTLSSVASTVGGWGGGWAGAKIGAMGGAAAGTLICPGIGTVVGGFIGGFVGGWAGSVARRESAGFLFDEAYQGY